MAKTFHVENYKGLKSVTLTPGDRTLIVIAGANGAGKSSFVDPIRELFRYKGVKETPRPIRDGEDTAEASYVDEALGIRFVRTWKRSASGEIKSTFSAYGLDGAKHTSATAILAEHLGGELIDPVEFTQLDEKKQRDVLLSKVDLPFDVDDLAAQKKGAEERRRAAGVEVKRLQGALASLPRPTVPAGTSLASATEILAELEAAQTANGRRFALVQAKANVLDEIEKLEARLAVLRTEAAELGTKLAATAAAVDTDAIRLRLSEVEETNAKVTAATSWHERKAELDAAEAMHAEHQAELDRIVQVKADGLAAAKFPLAGLSVDDEGVTFDGVPFIQLNSAQQIVVAFDIATSGNPDLKIIFIRNGDLLDDATLAEIAGRGDERGYTVIVERGRDNSAEIGYTIDDGELATA